MIQQILSTLVSFPSFAPQEKKISMHLQQLLSDIGFKIEIVDIGNKRNNILATRGKANHYPLFYGHMDTVELVNRNEWKTDPYILTQVDDYLYGLGAYDMKGGIAAFLYSLSHTKTPAKVLLCVDEEEISEGAWAVLEQRKDFFSDVDLIISAEPNFNVGVSGITTSRTGRCVFQAIVQGKPSHIATYKEGIDAVELASRGITALYAERGMWHKKYGTVVQVRKIQGSSVGMSVCSSVELDIEVMIGPSDSIETVQQRLVTLLEIPVTLKPRKTPYLPSYAFKKFPHQEIIATVIRSYAKQDLLLHSRQSVGDDNVLATLGIPVITWGPDGGNAHAPNEYVSLTSLDTLSTMYKEVLLQAYP